MKRRFQFRLDRLEKVRALEERIARAQWGEAEAVAARSAARVVELEATLTRARAELRLLLIESDAAPGAVDAYERPIETLCNHLEVARALHATHRAAADAEKAEWSLRQQAHRALERLEERARDEHRAAVNAADQAASDEANGARATHARRQSS